MRSQLYLLCLLSIVFAGTGIGCGKPDGKLPAAGAGPAASQAEDNALAAASPTDVVAQFYDALRGGEEGKIAVLLTDKARQETAKSGLDIRSPGSASLKYQIGELQYVTPEQDGAHVKSTWSEVDEDGQQVDTEVIWVLRKQADGWRIAGMATQIAEGQLPLLFNFEDPEDMLKKKDLVEKQTAAAEESVAEKTGPITADNPATMLR